MRIPSKGLPLADLGDVGGAVRVTELGLGSIVDGVSRTRCRHGDQSKSYISTKGEPSSGGAVAAATEQWNQSRAWTQLCSLSLSLKRVQHPRASS